MQYVIHYEFYNDDEALPIFVVCNSTANYYTIKIIKRNNTHNLEIITINCFLSLPKEIIIPSLSVKNQKKKEKRKMALEN